MLFRVDHYHHHSGGSSELRREVEQKFGHLERMMERMMASLEDIQNTLTTIGTEVDKVAGETQSLLDKIAQLQTTDPTQQALIDSIQTQAQGIASRLQAVDDLVPDATPPAEGTGGTDTGGTETGTTEPPAA